MVGLASEFVKGSFSIPAQVQYSIRNRGSYGYQYSNDLTWQLDPGYFAYLEHEGSLKLGLSLSGEFKGTDNLDGVSAEDTAITSVFAGPHVSGTLGDRLSGSLSCELPAVMNNSALQLVPDYRLRASVNVRL